LCSIFFHFEVSAENVKGPYVQIPSSFVIMNDYFHYENKFRGVKTVSDEKEQEKIKTKMFNYFKFLQLEGYDKKPH